VYATLNEILGEKEKAHNKYHSLEGNSLSASMYPIAQKSKNNKVKQSETYSDEEREENRKHLTKSSKE
jgi:hypothetical protein